MNNNNKLEPKENYFQKEVFLKQEGNNWYHRNSSQQQPIFLIDTLLKYIKEDFKVLEIGCSNGKNLSYIISKIPCKTYGIDPSSDAIEMGKKTYPNLNLIQATADNLPFSNDSFDVVYFGFCLYLIDPALLLKTFAEADRVLKDNGFLMITDFDSVEKSKTPYSHVRGMFSYRANYAQMLQAFHYQLAEKVSFSHAGPEFHADPKERVCHQIFYKDIKSSYKDFITQGHENKDV